MKIPFVGPFDVARSLNASAQRAVNVYLEMNNATPRAPLALYGTPGSVLLFTLGAAPVRKALTVGQYSYWVAGDRVYKVDAAYSATLLGTIGTTTGLVGMSSNGTEVLIVDGVGGWLISAGTLALITDPDFPVGVTQAGYLDGFFLVAGDGTGRIYCNETPGDGTAWNGTDYANAEGDPDNTLALIVDHREAWLIGSATAEIWVNVGNPDFPFARSGNAFIQIGTNAAASVAAMDNTIFWLGADSDGNGLVYKAQGYTPVRISSHALERAIQGYGDTSDARAFTFQMEGHTFYALLFPSADASWLYDVASGQWTEWAWRNPLAGTLHRHRSNCHTFFNGEHVVGDWETGNVYALRMETYTDADAPILRLRATQCLDSDDGFRLFYEELLVDMETGVGLATGQGSDPQLMLRYSNDGGHTWSNLRTRGIGAVGEYGARAKFGTLGSGRNRVWEVSMTDPVKFCVFGAKSRFTRGSS